MLLLSFSRLSAESAFQGLRMRMLSRQALCEDMELCSCWS